MTNKEKTLDRTKSYTFTIPTDRDGTDLPIKLTWTETGWFLEFGDLFGNCVKTGFPYVYRVTDRFGIEIPSKLHDYFERLWQMVKLENHSSDQIQKGFDELTNWIRKLNSSAPEGSLWEEVPASD